ncbi:hypothetical protein [Bacillus alkalicellulosilyticus]|uniref:hypothetical protein n=1 Tax=Alkalihalobacterium alkalicellulosilyticum TaxID=1912214 RepID=UPI000996B91E|nr:hypothetical protein [Bacillus alkalicellulosilyticus]
MENTLQYKKVMFYFKVLLLTLTILSTCFVIWTGFTGRQSIFPMLLCLTMLLSISNLLLGNEDSKRKTFYRILFFASCLSLAFAVLNLIVGR